jgi:polar amino acid transport system substrate-binding protein
VGGLRNCRRPDAPLGAARPSHAALFRMLANRPFASPTSLDGGRDCGYPLADRRLRSLGPNGRVGAYKFSGRRRIVVGRFASAALAAVVILGAAAAQAQTLERVRATGTFTIGYREDAAPYSYRNALGEPDGYSVELCRAIATNVKDALGLANIKVVYRPVTTEGRFQEVQDGRVDIECGATTVTLSRRELVDFSLFTFIDGASVLLRADSPPDLQGLAGKKVGVRGGTTTEQALRNTLAQEKIAAEVVTVGNHDDGLQRLQKGELAAYFADRAILLFLIAKSQDQSLRVSERFFTFEPYALALHQGDDVFRLLVDRTLSALYRSGKIHEIFTHAFGENAHESDMLKALYIIDGLPR